MSFSNAALDLLENVEVNAIIIPIISNGELFLARLGGKLNVPLLSFSSVSISNENPYFIQVAEDENNQFHGIAAFLEEFRWRSFVFLYEDTADARQAQTYIQDIFQENHLDIAYQTAISPHAADDQIVNELHKLMMMKASIIIVHLSHSLATQLFINAKMLGMMSKEFVWILTSKTTNFLDTLDSSVYESMQGVLGFRPYISVSNKIQNLTLRWRREFQPNKSNVDIKELNGYGVWAYDAASVLAEAVERAGIELSQNGTGDARLKQFDLARLRSKSGSSILRKITSSKYSGLQGKFRFSNRKLVPEIYEILNVIGKGQRRVGFWTVYGLTKDINSSINSSSGILETIIWPGFSSTAPERRLLQKSGKSFRIGIPANGRFPELVSLNHNQQHNTTTFGGFCVEVFRAVLDKLPYKISPEYIPFYNHYGSYNDLTYQVYLQVYLSYNCNICITSVGKNLTIQLLRRSFCCITIRLCEFVLVM